MQSKAATVGQYLNELPDGRREAIEAVRQTILQNLPSGYEEAMNWGMITYQVPLEIYPDTYNGKPLMYAALASQKNHMAVYLTGIYMDNETRTNFETEYKSTGKRYDAGKSCVRFRKLDDLPLELIGKTIASIKIDDFISQVKKNQSARTKKSSKDAAPAGDFSRLTRPLHPMPEFVETALHENDLFDAYRSRPPYQQNDYISWITRAKREKTQQKRLEQMIDELEKGDLYMKMNYNPGGRKS